MKRLLKIYILERRKRILEIYNLKDVSVDDLVNALDHSIFCLPGFLSFRNEITANKKE